MIILQVLAKHRFLTAVEVVNLAKHYKELVGMDLWTVT